MDGISKMGILLVTGSVTGIGGGASIDVPTEGGITGETTEDASCRGKLTEGKVTDEGIRRGIGDGAE